MRFSINNNLILEPYLKTRELESKQIATGFVGTAQKTGIESLELLVDATCVMGDNVTTIPAGSRVFFKESTLYIQPWAREVFKKEGFEKGFLIANITDVLYIEGQDETS